MSEQFINISWMLSSLGLVSLAAQGVYYMCNLTISHGSITEVIPINELESTYHFTAPEGAPPCEVYNFSVTVTYVGATYTGAGCSVPSIANKIMLPSLPNLGRMESSLIYSLVQHFQQFILNISIEVS